MYFDRSLTARLRVLSRSFPAIVITGARQVGKTTLLKHVFSKKAETVTFDPIIDIGNARQDPELFLKSRSCPLILDEIQYAPELIPVIKRRIDEDRRPGRYLITGSQQWGVMKSLAESLAGRCAFLDLDGFSLAEISRMTPRRSWLEEWLDNPDSFARKKIDRLPVKRTSFEQIWRGWLPEAQFIPLAAIPDFHLAYQRTYVERDARLLADVSDWQLFGCFIRLAAALTARQINHSELGRELGLTPQTSRRWLDILMATFQWFEIPAYAPNTLKRLSNKPKGYIADTGFACWAQAISTPRAVASHPSWGALFETAVVSEIKKLCDAMKSRPILHHWHAHSGGEVDLLLERDGIFHPIEVKAGTRVSRMDTSGITAFRKSFPKLRVAKGLIIAPVDEFRPISEDDYVMPWDTSSKRGKGTASRSGGS
jgi:hypothetical protein